MNKIKETIEKLQNELKWWEDGVKIWENAPSWCRGGAGSWYSDISKMWRDGMEKCQERLKTLIAKEEAKK